MAGRLAALFRAQRTSNVADVTNACPDTHLWVMEVAQLPAVAIFAATCK